MQHSTKILLRTKAPSFVSVQIFLF